MKSNLTLFCGLIFWLILTSCGTDKLREPAQQYANSAYGEAADGFSEAREYYPALHAELSLATANALLGADSLEQAERGYLVVQNNLKSSWQSLAHNNLGIISIRRERTEQALERLKNALLTDPNNEAARYNYELLKRRQGEDPPPPWQPPPNMPPPPIPPEDQQPAEQAGSLYDFPELRPAARKAAIDALQERDKLYYQELKKVQRESGYVDPDRPNW